MGCLRLFFSVLALASAQASGSLLEGVAAVVNGHVILHSEVSQASKKPEITGTEIEIRKKALDQLINEYLVQQETSRLGLTANDAAIDGAISQVMKQNGFASMAELKKALAKENLSFDDYRASIKKQIETYRLISETIRPKVQITEQDIQAEFRRQNSADQAATLTQLKMIFRKKGSAGSDAKGMERLVRELKTGIPFETVANRETEGPGKGDGGSIGAVNPDDMQPELARVIKAMKPGETSGVITTAQGSYILYCVGREKASAPILNESTRKEISDKLTNDETARQFDSFIRSLREKAQIEVRM
jgi:peptidyl-prolyl cis-trans isomerase SurA